MLWFERLYAKLGLPFWAGSLISSSLVPISISFAAIYAKFGFLILSGQAVATYAGWFSLLLVSQFAARYLCRHMDSLHRLVTLMNSGRAPRIFPNADSLWGAFFVYNGMIAGMQWSGYVGILSGTGELYVTIFLATFVWVFVSSILSITRMSGLPLELKPFTEDPVLGLQPFADTVLRLTFSYESVLMGVFLYPIFAHMECGCSPNASPIYEASFGAAFLLGLASLVLPLYRLHLKMSHQKHQDEGWVNNMYTGIIRRIRTESVDEYNGETASLLVGIDKIQKDVRHIQRWPFDSGNLAKLVSLVLIPILIEVAVRAITNTFGF